MARDRYSHVFVPLDGTPFSEAAVRPAAEIAARSGGALHLVSVVGDKGGKKHPVAMSLAPLPPEGVGRKVPLAQQLEERLAEVAERVRSEWSCKTTFELAKGDPSADTLLAAAERANADLIVAATHSRGAVARALLGSTSADLSREAEIPVLLIPSEDAEPAPESTPMQGKVDRIAVALGSDTEVADAVVGNALTQALLWEASLVLIHAVPILPAPSMAAGAYEPVSTGAVLETDERSLHLAEERVGKLVSALADFGIEAQAEVLQAPNVADTVLERAEDNEADLVVVGRHERGVWERLWKGSESDRLARHVRSVGLLVCPLGNGST
jgi:nucleotide-binding universal stress UspA family protein